jgi:hypothetical protein
MPSVCRAAVACASLAAACSSGPSKTVYFDLASTGSAETFWNYPYPSDLRLDANGAPELTTFPNPRNVPILTDLLSIVPQRRGYPQMPAGYFRFTAPIPARAITDVITDDSALLIDVDPNSPERGTSFPIVAQTLQRDPYITSNLLALAPRPGIVLRGGTQYAYVVTKTMAPGFEAPSHFDPRDSMFTTTFATLATLGVAKTDVLAATLFTTGDEVARTRARSEAIRQQFAPTIQNLALAGGDTYAGFCMLTGQITMPQFQTGTQPFDSGGLFVLDGNDVPMQQGSMTIPVTITLPKAAMPAAGWPLYQWFHGSGGLSTQVVNAGPATTSADNTTPGEGPSYVVALHGLAAASSALPLNPERLPGASDYEYINLNNLAAYPQTFVQGVFEQRMLTDALLALQIPQSLLAGCTGISTPAASGNHFFNPAQLVAGGQSMGGMYTNTVGAVEPRFGALVPTGAGGFWNLMILETTLIPGARELLEASLNIDDSQLFFAHPAMNMLQTVWESAEPLVYMSRVAHRPLPGLPARSVYEPVGYDDTYFQPDVYDAAALSFENQEVGTPLSTWPSMQTALTLENLGSPVNYPVKANQTETRVVVQYMGDGIVDPHYIFRQLDAVKHQYGCFLESYLRDGVPTVPAPGGLTDPCP